MAASVLAAGRRLLDEARRQPLLAAAGVALLIALAAAARAGLGAEGLVAVAHCTAALQRWWRRLSEPGAAPARR